MKVSLGPKTYASPNPVWVLGSYNPDGKPNIMTAAYCTSIHISPPLLIIALNPNSQTFKNIEKRKAFTVNMPGAEHWRETDYIGMVSGKDHDKFKLTASILAKNSSMVDQSQSIGSPDVNGKMYSMRSSLCSCVIGYMLSPQLPRVTVVIP